MSKPASATKVISVTLNPSLERTLVTHFLALGYPNRATEKSRVDPAGRGLGVSRALHSLGVPTHAILLIGNDATGHAYQALLTEEQFPIAILRREGYTRSTIVFKDTGHNQETCIWEDGDDVTHHNLQMVIDTLQELIDAGDVVVFAGSLPNNLPPVTYAQLTDVAQSCGAQVAINAGGGEALQKSLKAEPELVYLTQTQAEGLFNYPVRTYEDVIHCAQKLREQGVKTVLMAINETSKAILVAEEGIWIANWPEELSGTRRGQAEAMIAGYLAGRLAQYPVDEALELGGAAASYTLSQIGQEFGTIRDAEERIDDVDLTSADDSDELK